MKRLVRDVGLLVLTGALALSATLAWRHWTSAAIADAEKQLNSRQRLAVLPEGSYDNPPLDNPLPRPAAQRPNSRILAAYRATLAGKPAVCANGHAEHDRQPGGRTTGKPRIRCTPGRSAA